MNFPDALQSFFGVPHNSVAQIASFFKPKFIPKGTYFVKTGQPVDQLAFVQRGLVREFLSLNNGGEVTKWIAWPGYFITDVTGFFFRQPARCHWQALTDTELLVVNASDYHQLSVLVPEWHRLEKMFIARCFSSLEDRIIAHLSLSAEERYALFFSQQPELFNQVPLQYLASLLGMTPETFSRIRKKHRDGSS
jgi:CRP-like cAMP-binding protein